MYYFCGLDYLSMVQRNALVFAYCFVDDEDFAFICLIFFFLSPLLYHQSPDGKGFIYSVCFDRQTLPATRRGNARGHQVTSWEGLSVTADLQGLGGSRGWSVEIASQVIVGVTRAPCAGQGSCCSNSSFPLWIWILLLRVLNGVLPKFVSTWDLECDLFRNRVFVEV